MQLVDAENQAPDISINTSSKPVPEVGVSKVSPAVEVKYDWKSLFKNFLGLNWLIMFFKEITFFI